jgi:hypothetical protein
MIDHDYPDQKSMLASDSRREASRSEALFLTALGSGVCEVSPDSNFTSASSRLKLIPALRSAEDLGLQPRLLSVDIDRPEVINHLGSPRICVIDKIMSNKYDRICGFAMAILAAVTRLKNQGALICLTYSDHHASSENVVGSLYRDLLIVSDIVVVPCQAMADAVSQTLNKRPRCIVIEDPWQVREQGFTKWQEENPFRLAWFGNPSNVEYLCNELPRLMARAHGAKAYELTVLARRESIQRIDLVFTAAKAIRPWRLVPLEWDTRRQPQQLESVLGESHACLLPSNYSDKKKIGVSHNRMVDSIRSGCIAIASPMPSYTELKKVALISNDLAGTLNQLPAEYERLCAKYSSLRAHELLRFSPERNHEQWTNLLRSVIQS